MISLCNDWSFTYSWYDGFSEGIGDGVPVRLPHTVKEIPLHSASPDYYETVCGYRRKLAIPAEYCGKRLFLQFDGAAHIAVVYVNGVCAGEHRCGYTAFRVEITDYVRYGEDNLISVKLDCTENPAVPPFGFVIDYLTYGGLYREVWLDVREKTYLEDVFVITPDTHTAEIQLTVNGSDSVQAEVEILDGSGRALACAGGTDTIAIEVPEAQPWSCDSPVMYDCRVRLSNGDSLTVPFGFRTAVFKNDGLYINGVKTYMRGLNRHQCYPYMGYAAPESLQREDARILRHELQCNAVRTSHYPQSQYFIDECDRQGLLVFTEIPGWQHIGDDAWKNQACENVREMVLQYRNHPSIVLWGVRINESQDDDGLYTRTNAIAHELDPSRATSGVRYIEQSHLLEDVYAYNDFSHTGSNPGVRPKKAVTPDMNRALLISEHNGHMFPTKSFDTWSRRQEHAMRHARVQNDAAADGGHVGCFGWCMFDYPTHKDFGSGDRVCYHGVMDAFRNPKPAAYLYTSQGDEFPVIYVSSSMDIGDYPGGKMETPEIFTNADEVKLYKNDMLVKSYFPDRAKALPHYPIAVDDLIGDLLETCEGFSRAKARQLRTCLNIVKDYGYPGLPVFKALRLGFAMLRWRMSFSQAFDLYGKYVGNWGGEATVWRFDAIKDGLVAASTTKYPSNKLRLEVIAGRTGLCEGASYDICPVRIRIIDETGNVAPYAQQAVRLSLTGDAELVGPDAVTAEGGMCGAYVRSLGHSGKAHLTISADCMESVGIDFTVTV